MRRGLAHILVDGTVADWDPCAEPNYCLQYNQWGVSDLAVNDGVVYVGGYYGGIDLPSVSGIAAVAGVSGVPPAAAAAERSSRSAHE
jgi:hypothetical protein